MRVTVAVRCAVLAMAIVAEARHSRDTDQMNPSTLTHIVTATTAWFQTSASRRTFRKSGTTFGSRVRSARIRHVPACRREMPLFLSKTGAGLCRATGDGRRHPTSTPSPHVKCSPTWSFRGNIVARAGLSRTRVFFLPDLFSKLTLSAGSCLLERERERERERESASVEFLRLRPTSNGSIDSRFSLLKLEYLGLEFPVSPIWQRWKVF